MKKGLRQGACQDIKDGRLPLQKEYPSGPRPANPLPCAPPPSVIGAPKLMLHSETIKDVLPVPLFLELREEMREWDLTNAPNPGNPPFLRLWDLTNLLYFQASTVVKLKVQRLLKTDLRLVKIHTNGQFAGQESAFHTDFPMEKVWTFVLFTEKNWVTSWGGEFVCFNPGTREYEYCPYIPNSGVLIPSNWEHFGSAPNSSTREMRTSVAFSYATPLVADSIFTGYPTIANKFR